MFMFKGAFVLFCYTPLYQWILVKCIMWNYWGCFFYQNGFKVTNLNILMRAPKRYAVQIIQCMARSDIYEGHYDFYLGCVLSVWIWSVPRDQEPIYQPDSWRCVRWGTSAIPCSHSKTLNIYWDWYWQSREMHQLRIKEVDDNEVWFQTLSSGHPEATCFHRLNGESRKSTKFLPPNFLPQQNLCF